MTDLWRVVDGIERDFDHELSPWLRSRSKMGGDPADRTIEAIERLIELVRKEDSNIMSKPYTYPGEAPMPKPRPTNDWDKS